MTFPASFSEQFFSSFFVVTHSSRTLWYFFFLVNVCFQWVYIMVWMTMVTCNCSKYPQWMYAITEILSTLECCICSQMKRDNTALWLLKIKGWKKKKKRIMCSVFSECKPSCTNNIFCTEFMRVFTKQMFNMFLTLSLPWPYVLLA